MVANFTFTVHRFLQNIQLQMQKKKYQIPLAYGLLKETVNAMMMLYKNTKVMVCPPDGDTIFFNIGNGIFQGDILAPYLLTHCLDYRL